MVKSAVSVQIGQSTGQLALEDKEMRIQDWTETNSLFQKFDVYWWPLVNNLNCCDKNQQKLTWKKNTRQK